MAPDPVNRTVRLARGRELSYDGLIIATGARVRRLAAPAQRGELVVPPTVRDAELIAARLLEARSALVVGAGFLGMEVASTLRRRGLAVTVVHQEPTQEALL
ncbi:FAD-dependent oxidoreductase [Georgenia sp. EYE_87]|uniref:FAD-dependent oxidoreductase n=1 Tax=Georgenia sp. EYE_87 TaxID=2853448 RepID=UPI002006AEEB|nr:FAD-dependent oxidoreductase [Georgenia sp. EYE_87]MCK6212101.1 FAD-dependent oxidoreductase [Georgenia sp. EYE_87]